MSRCRSARARVLAASFAAGCAAHEQAPPPAAAPASAPACAGASAIQWGPEHVGESPSAGACAELLSTADGVYVAERLAEPARIGVTRLGDATPALSFAHVTSATFAAQPRRRELVIAGRYEQRLPSLPADAPDSGYFVLAVEPHGKLLWSVGVPSEADDDGDLALVLTDDGSVILAGNEAFLRRVPGVSASLPGPAAGGWAMLAITQGRVTHVAGFAGTPLMELSGTAPNALYVAEQEGDVRVLSRLSPTFAPLWRKPLPSFALQSLVASASGVWLASTEFVASSSRAHLDARVTHYAPDGATQTSFAFGDDARGPFGHQRLQRLALAEDGAVVWALGTFETSVAIAGHSLRTTEFGKVSFVSAVTTGGRPLLLAGLRTQSTELSPQLLLTKDRALIARDDGEGGCELGRISLVTKEPR